MRARTVRGLLASDGGGAPRVRTVGRRGGPSDSTTNQGRLFDADGAPIDGTLKVLFALYDAPDATVPIWSEEHDIAFDEGYYSVSLGSVVPFDADVFDGNLRYFGITIGDEPELLPRSVVQSVPYALLAQDVNGDIHPTSVTIPNGTEVINDQGEWGGSADWPFWSDWPCWPDGAGRADGCCGRAWPHGCAGANGGSRAHRSHWPCRAHRSDWSKENWPRRAHRCYGSDWTGRTRRAHRCYGGDWTGRTYRCHWSNWSRRTHRCHWGDWPCWTHRCYGSNWPCRAYGC